MRFLVFLSLVFFFFSCGEKRKVETGDDEMKATEIGDTTIDEFSETEIDTTVNNKDSIAFAGFKIDSRLSFPDKVKLFQEKYAFFYVKEGETPKMILPDRYDNIYTEKFLLKKKTPVPYGKVENVYPVAQLYFYQYKDSATCRNVMNNWLQCYGFDCTPVEFMVDLPAIKTTPSLAIFNEKEIIFLQYQCEHIGNNWNDVKKDLINIFAQKGASHTLTLSDCGKKLVWK